jgi:hypothetical protein
LCQSFVQTFGRHLRAGVTVRHWLGWPHRPRTGDHTRDACVAEPFDGG